MLTSQPASAVTANTTSERKKRVQGTGSFARALSEGLIDVAFAFDGVFRPAGSMSLAERAAYGLRSNRQTVTHQVTSAAHGAPATSRKRQVASGSAARPLNVAARAIAHARVAIAAAPAAAFEEVRREARLRHASSTDALRARAGQNRAIGRLGLRASTKVGSARLDVIVAGGGRSASVMQWMR